MKMNRISRYHFAMGRERFNQYKARPTENLSIRFVEATVDNVLQRVGRINWGWIYKDIYKPQILSRRLKSPHVRLYDLYDGEQAVGYCLVSPPSNDQAFLSVPVNHSVIEIENLALYPGQEGRGRGWSFFSLVMEDLYKDYDGVYWFQSSTNYPTLKQYYLNHGMRYLGEDYVPDFRPEHVAVA